MIYRNILKYSIAFLLIFTGATPAVTGQTADRRISSAERKADRKFIRQDFDKAMAMYESVGQNGRRLGDTVDFHIKVARLYFMLRDFPQSADHFGKARSVDPDRLSVNDVCDFIDALRFDGRFREAEAVALDYAYKDIYSRYQRYQNILDALAMKHDMTVDAPYMVRRLSINSPLSEYWVGIFGGQPIYAASFSNFSDPSKLFYHRTRYYELNEKETPLRDSDPDKPVNSEFFKRIPVDLHRGPVAVSPDMSLLIATSTDLGSKSRISNVGATTRPFRTRLVYSVIDKKQNRFTKYYPVFRQEPQVSYAHPCITADGKSLIFTSDMPGGYGGFDLYISHWDEQNNKWGEPVNLGPDINTEGDEIFPVQDGDQLIFSSNGHKGFGGYDLFTVVFEEGSVVANSLRHLPYPINTEFNDTYMMPLDGRSGYIISDRNGDSKDDIFYYQAIEVVRNEKGSDHFGVSDDFAVLGGQLLANNATEKDVKTELVSLSAGGDNWELMVSVYFDFDSYALDKEALKVLEEFLGSVNFYHYSQVDITGYTDIIGRENYNFKLSQRRAETVADYLTRSGKATLPITTEGKGPLKLRPEELEYPGEGDGQEFNDRIRMNRRARRVEIYIK